jgi:hypothetical protein
MQNSLTEEQKKALTNVYEYLLKDEERDFNEIYETDGDVPKRHLFYSLLVIEEMLEIKKS